MQLELFSEEHEHVFQEFHGPILVNDVIQLGYKGDKWCWTCISWVDIPPKEMAEFFALEIKKGRVSKSDAIERHCYWNKLRFIESVEAINIAIGDLNSGRLTD